jgi:hypothetical protein
MVTQWFPNGDFEVHKKVQTPKLIHNKQLTL